MGPAKPAAESQMRALDAGDLSPKTGLGLVDPFADDAEVFFPSVWRGKGQGSGDRDGL
jgi:hypothetical protein